jgi:hypothetical protein
MKGYFTMPYTYETERDRFIYFPQPAMTTAIDRTTP